MTSNFINLCILFFLKKRVGQGLVEDHALWNAMINPLTKTSIRGSLWYQG